MIWGKLPRNAPHVVPGLHSRLSTTADIVSIVGMVDVAGLVDMVSK